LRVSKPSESSHFRSGDCFDRGAIGSDYNLGRCGCGSLSLLERFLSTLRFVAVWLSWVFAGNPSICSRKWTRVPDEVSRSPRAPGLIRTDYFECPRPARRCVPCLLGSCAPTTEEALCRGLFLPGFCVDKVLPGAIVLSACCCCVVDHMKPWQFLSAQGASVAGALRKTRLLYVLLGHALFNSAAFSLLICPSGCGG